MLMTIAAAVEAMRADTTLGQSDAIDEILESGELQCRQPQTLGNLIHHPLVLW